MFVWMLTALRWLPLSPQCVSPLTITAKDFGAKDTRHSVAVTFRDACGRVKNAGFEYTQVRMGAWGAGGEKPVWRLAACSLACC